MASIKVVNQEVKQKATTEQWAERLGTLLRTVDAMDDDERTAALRYVKAKFPRDWPSDDY